MTNAACNVCSTCNLMHCVNKLVFVGDIAVKICLKSTSGSVPHITATMTGKFLDVARQTGSICTFKWNEGENRAEENESNMRSSKATCKQQSNMAYSLNNLTKTSVRIQLFGDDLKKQHCPASARTSKQQRCVSKPNRYYKCVVSR